MNNHTRNTNTQTSTTTANIVTANMHTANTASATTAGINGINTIKKKATAKINTNHATTIIQTYT
eukprot:4372343-Pyramimonas_sp.AAC.1